MGPLIQMTDRLQFWESFLYLLITFYLCFLFYPSDFESHSHHSFYIFISHSCFLLYFLGDLFVLCNHSVGFCLHFNHHILKFQGHLLLFLIVFFNFFVYAIISYTSKLHENFIFLNHFLGKGDGSFLCVCLFFSVREQYFFQVQIFLFILLSLLLMLKGLLKCLLIIESSIICIGPLVFNNEIVKKLFKSSRSLVPVLLSWLGVVLPTKRMPVHSW